MKRHKLDPRTKRLERTDNQYKVVAVGLYKDLADSLDRAAIKLQEAGYLKANRSFVVQALVRKLQREIKDLDSDAILDYFLRTHLRRPLAEAPARRRTPESERTAKDPASKRLARG
jgi:hypothetical protein